MQLIADSGSTKTSWKLVKSHDDMSEASTVGYNPHYFNSDDIEQDVRAKLIPQLGVSAEAVAEVFFYGAGCSTAYSCSIVEVAFRRVFPNAHIEIEHDLLAAARAACGKAAGIACILGTGSNSCLYDGSQITDHVNSLGFILGDEGSGAELGRQLVKAYIYREMPKEVSEAFAREYDVSMDAIYQNVYREHTPSRYMAQFTKFINQRLDHPFLYNLVKKAFTAFLETQPMKYQGVYQLPISFVGSVAHYFRPVLEEIFDEKNLNMGNIVRNPIDQLVKFHTR